MEIDEWEVFHQNGNGMQIKPVLSVAGEFEKDFQEWLLRVGGVGTRPEYMVYRVLERRFGMRAPESDPPGFDFQFQVPAGGGRGREGGAVLDIVVQSVQPPIAIRVQGEFFHFLDVDIRESDVLERAMLEGLGFRVVDILAQDLIDEARAEIVVAMALRGVQLDTTGRTGVFR
jgi:hypothetical protein